jgi:hypothetical protein
LSASFHPYVAIGLNPLIVHHYRNRRSTAPQLPSTSEFLFRYHPVAGELQLARTKSCPPIARALAIASETVEALAASLLAV